MISEHTGLLPGEAVETYEAINLSKREAQHLTCQPASAALKITRISRNTSGEIFEYCTIIARGDMNKYQIILKNNGMQYSHVI
ncbi:MAG: UTRA domain-containing protein [Lachnospiraceae bacterium]|nr:UTRA domain-containing protein [Lachnospiraceae bacterium]